MSNISLLRILQLKAYVLKLLRTKGPGALALAVLVGIGVLILAPLAASSQSPTQYGPRVYNNDNEHVGEFLTSIPDLPYLPLYPGKIVFERAVRWQKSGGRVAYSITFHARELPENVIDWYRSMFQSYKWLVEKENSGPKLTEARMGKYFHVRAMAMHSARKDYPANIHLTYSITGQERTP